jgi:AcrR family transcriptional regulator
VNGRVMSRTSERTRQAVIEAAIHCLAQEGFHGATSNRIAREAGVTWGVIQYHFGDRDGIYKAVLDRVMDDYVVEIEQISSVALRYTLRERLGVLVVSVWKLLNRPDYLATMELLVNIPRNTESALLTKPYVTRWSRRMSVLWEKLFPEYGSNNHDSAAARHVFFALMRGLVDSRLIGQFDRKKLPESLVKAIVVACEAVLLKS